MYVRAEVAQCPWSGPCVGCATLVRSADGAPIPVRHLDQEIFVSRMFSTCSAALLALALLAPSAQAQRRRAAGGDGAPPPAVGARIGYDFDANQMFLGGQFEFPVGRRLRLVPSLELYPGGSGAPPPPHPDPKIHPPPPPPLFSFPAPLPPLPPTPHTTT